MDWERGNCRRITEVNCVKIYVGLFLKDETWALWFL